MSVSVKDKKAAKHLRSQGAPDDTVLAHVNPRELSLLDQLSVGGGAINPRTGIPEFSDTADYGEDYAGGEDFESEFADAFGDTDVGLWEQAKDFFISTFLAHTQNEVNAVFDNTPEVVTDPKATADHTFEDMLARTDIIDAEQAPDTQPEDAEEAFQGEAMDEFTADFGTGGEGGAFDAYSQIVQDNQFANQMNAGYQPSLNAPQSEVAGQIADFKAILAEIRGDVNTLNDLNDNTFAGRAFNDIEQEDVNPFGDLGPDTTGSDILRSVFNQRAIDTAGNPDPAVEQSSLTPDQLAQVGTTDRVFNPGSVGASLQQQLLDAQNPVTPDPNAVQAPSVLDQLLAAARGLDRGQGVNEEDLGAKSPTSSFFNEANKGFNRLRIGKAGGVPRSFFDRLVNESNGDPNLLIRKLRAQGITNNLQRDDGQGGPGESAVGGVVNVADLINPIRRDEEERARIAQSKVLNLNAAFEAFSNANTGIDDLIAERGFTRDQGFAQGARDRVQDTFFDFQPGFNQSDTFNNSLNADIGRLCGEEALTNKRQEFIDTGSQSITDAFPDGGFNIDQSIIDSIVDERLNQGSQVIAGQQARGNFNEAGITSANEQLQSQRPRINDQVFGLAESFVPGIDSTVGDIRGRAQEANEGFQLGDELFNVGAFTDERDTFLGDQNTGFTSQINDAIGSDPLFNIGDSLAAGRKSQGVVSGPQQGTLLDTLAARENGGISNRTNRGLGTRGSGAF